MLTTTIQGGARDTRCTMHDTTVMILVILLRAHTRRLERLYISFVSIAFFWVLEGLLIVESTTFLSKVIDPVPPRP